MNLSILTFGANEIQPYMYAMAVELPHQVQDLQDVFMKHFGHGADTTQLSCQDSEHNGYVLKQVEQLISDHKSIVPPESWDGDMTMFARDRLCRPFVHDLIMKDWKYRYGLPASHRKPRASHKLKLEGGCPWCNLPELSLEHKAFCEHVLFKPILEAANTGKWPEEIDRIMRSEDTKSELTSASCRETRKPQRQDRSFDEENTIQTAAKTSKALKGLAKTRSAVVRER